MSAAVASARPSKAAERRTRARPRPESVLVLYKQLASAIDAGLTVSRALQGALAEMEDQALRAAVEDVARRVDAGEALSSAMSRWPRAFSPLACSMVRAAERSGALATAFRVVESVEHRALQVRRTIRGAMVYPAIVVAASLTVVAVLSIVVLPKFAEVFEASQVQMPALTRMLMAGSRFAASAWWAILPAMLLAGAGLYRWAQTPEGKRRLDRTLWAFPKIGTALRKLQLAQVSSALAGLLRAGVPLIEALELVERTAQNTVLRGALRSIREATGRGLPLSRAMQQSQQVPGMLVQLVAMGEETGQLPRMLDDYAQIAREDAEVAVQTMLRLLEPAMLLIVGGMVAFIAASVYVPLSQLGNVIAGGAK
jgi:type II secretory pathway component PulF